jgi:hypothetical protein
MDLEGTTVITRKNCQSRENIVGSPVNRLTHFLGRCQINIVALLKVRLNVAILKYCVGRFNDCENVIGGMRDIIRRNSVANAFAIVVSKQAVERRFHSVWTGQWKLFNSKFESFGNNVKSRFGESLHFRIFLKGVNYLLLLHYTIGRLNVKHLEQLFRFVLTAKMAAGAADLPKRQVVLTCPLLLSRLRIKQLLNSKPYDYHNHYAQH